MVNMSPKAASKKRPLNEAAGFTEQSPLKPKNSTARMKESTGTAAMASASSSGSSTAPNPVILRIPLGPNGECFMPEMMPRECVDVINKLPMPSRWVRAIDATPGREMTLGSRQWWEMHWVWLEANKKSLNLKAEHWKMRDEAMAREYPLEDDEGKNSWDFVCFYPPVTEEEDEDDDDDDDDDDNDDGQDGSDRPASNPFNDTAKPAKLGEERSRWWVLEVLKRDQDDFMMHIYNDFSPYGVLEVLDNLFLHFDKVNKRKPSYQEIWPEIEGLALLLCSGVVEFASCDDPDRCGSAIELIGYLTLAVMDSLRSQGVLIPNPQIPNLGLVLSMLIKWAWGLNNYSNYWSDNISWVFPVIKLTEDAQITLGGPSGFAELLEEINAESQEQTKQGTWAKNLRSHASKYGPLGGTQYDITKMSAAERRKHSYAG